MPAPAKAPHDTQYDAGPPIPSVVDHDDYQLELEPSIYPQQQGPAEAVPADSSSAALLSLLNRARAQTDLPVVSAASAVVAKRPAQAQHTFAEPLSVQPHDDDGDDEADDIVIDEDHLELGEVEDLNRSQREPDAFGEEDSGPVPMSAPRLRPASASRGSSARRSSGRRSSRSQASAPRPETTGAHSAVKRLSAKTKNLLDRIPPRVMVGSIAALMLCGVLYVFFGGDAAPSSEAGPNAFAASQAENPAPNGGAEASSTPDMELIPLSDGDASADGAAADSPNHPLFPRSALAHTAKPLSTKQVKMGRVCVLREGPSSRFKATVNQTPAGAKVTVLAESEGQWVIASHEGLTGWSKTPCSAAQACTLRQGPGEQFKVITNPPDTLKVNGPVKSSERWRYVKYEDLYGWMGPACWK